MRSWLGLLCGLPLLAACALPPNVVVVLPDDNQNVGSAIVSNAHGTSVLKKPLAAVSLAQNAAPGEPFIAEREPVESVFAAPLRATPRRPAVFEIYFEPESAELTPQSQAALAGAIKLARATATPDISVVANSDPGSPPPRGDLPPLRTAAVRDALIRAGLDPAAIDVADYGTSHPLVSSPANQPEPRNTRVELTIR